MPSGVPDFGLLSVGTDEAASPGLCMGHLACPGASVLGPLLDLPGPALGRSRTTPPLHHHSAEV